MLTKSLQRAKLLDVDYVVGKYKSFIPLLPLLELDVKTIIQAIAEFLSEHPPEVWHFSFDKELRKRYLK